MLFAMLLHLATTYTLATLVLVTSDSKNTFDLPVALTPGSHFHGLPIPGFQLTSTLSPPSPEPVCPIVIPQPSRTIRIHTQVTNASPLAPVPVHVLDTSFVRVVVITSFVLLLLILCAIIPAIAWSRSYKPSVRKPQTKDVGVQAHACCATVEELRVLACDAIYAAQDAKRAYLAKLQEEYEKEERSMMKLFGSTTQGTRFQGVSREIFELMHIFHIYLTP